MRPQPPAEKPPQQHGQHQAAASSPAGARAAGPAPAHSAGPPNGQLQSAGSKRGGSRAGAKPGLQQQALNGRSQPHAQPQPDPYRAMADRSQATAAASQGTAVVRVERCGASFIRLVPQRVAGNGQLADVPAYTMWNFYCDQWRPFGKLLTDMERQGFYVDRCAASCSATQCSTALGLRLGLQHLCWSAS